MTFHTFFVISVSVHYSKLYCYDLQWPSFTFVTFSCKRWNLLVKINCYDLQWPLRRKWAKHIDPRYFISDFQRFEKWNNVLYYKMYLISVIFLYFLSMLMLYKEFCNKSLYLFSLQLVSKNLLLVHYISEIASTNLIFLSKLCKKIICIILVFSQ